MRPVSSLTERALRLKKSGEVHCHLTRLAKDLFVTMFRFSQMLKFSLEANEFDGDETRRDQLGYSVRVRCPAFERRGPSVLGTTVECISVSSRSTAATCRMFLSN